MTQFKLTPTEQQIIIAQLNSNGCNAKTAEDLLVDNYSCASMSDYREIVPFFSKYRNVFTDQQIGGYLSSLEKKDIISRDEDADRGITLWWITDNYLKSLSPSTKFSTLEVA